MSYKKKEHKWSS